MRCSPKAVRQKKNEPLSIERILGIAMGCMGMGLDDFSLCTPSEFTAIYEAWKERIEHTDRQSWEQARFLGCAMLQPYSKKHLKPTDLIRFDWDRPEADLEKKENRLTPEERRAEEERIKALYG